MSYMFQDLMGLALATLLAPLVLYLPGLGLVRLLNRVGLAVESYWQRIGWAMLLGLALLPVFDTLLIRVTAMPGMALLHAGLAAYGLPLLKDYPRRTSLLAFIGLAMAWWLICAWSFIDLENNGKLYQSIIVLDMVKHAAVTEQIVREGIPFSDPFFARNGIAGYYHYFYVWPALIRWLGGAWIDARMAFGGAAFWTGFAAIALVWRIMSDAAFIRHGRDRKVLFLIIAFCFVAGTDLFFMLLRYLGTHRVEPQLDTWNSEIRTVGTSLIWVPHHVSAVIAAWTGMLLLVRRPENCKVKDRIWLALMAGAAFATMFGASVWIAIAIAPFLAGWAILRLARRDITLAVAGITALLLSLPQIIDIVHARATEAFPISFGVRSFTPFFMDDSVAGQLLRTPLLPVNYAMELGLCAMGSYFYWRKRKGRSDSGTATRQLLFWSTLATLVVASFLRSSIIYNDLGWRAALFAVIATMIWTLRYAQSVPSLAKLRPLAMTLLILGLAGSAWDVLGLRVIRAPTFPVRPIELNNAPAISYALRTAYKWMDGHLPQGAVVQYNPAITSRAVDFGLYGHHWPAIADAQANLFGVSAQATENRLKSVTPIFTMALPLSEMMGRARAAHIDYLLFTMRDPVWRKQDGPPRTLRCIYRTPLLCIAPVEEQR